MTKEERLLRQRQRQEELKKIESELRKKGFRYIAGVDEVGRGPLAGPVVTAAVVLPEDFDVPGVDDSKKLSEKRREALYSEIMEQALAVGIGQVDHDVIDEINILQATKRAMYQAVEEADRALSHRCGGRIDHVLVDAVELPDLHIPQEAIVKGDAASLAIAAASIIAKVTRDRMMIAFAGKYPGYAFEKNKGYGTKEHYEGIRRQGTCPIHRRSFLKNVHG